MNSCKLACLRSAGHKVLVISLGLCGLPVALDAQEDLTLTLEAALEWARNDHRTLRAARLNAAAYEGDLAQASILLAANPELSASHGRRGARDSDAFSPEFEVGFEQRFEIGGQRGKRIDRAGADLRAARAEVADAERIISLAVADAFYSAVAAEEGLSLAQNRVALSTELLDLAERRLSSGIGTPIEVNSAVIRHAEAQRRLIVARTRRDDEGLTLRRLTGRDLAGGVAIVGELPGQAHEISEEAIVARAARVRPDLAAGSARVVAAAATEALIRAESWPDVALEVAFGREEGQDLMTAGLRVPLAIFDRNQGARPASRSRRERELAAREDLALSVEAEARRAVRRYRRAAETLRLYSADVLTAQRETLELVQLAAASGELSVADVLVVQRELLDGLEGYLTARLDLAKARALVLAAAALPQTTELDGEVR